MDSLEDCFLSLPSESVAAESSTSPSREPRVSPSSMLTGGVASVARLLGFDLLDQPLVGGLPQCPDEVLVARATVALRQTMIGQDVVVLFEGGEVRRPIVMGVVQERPAGDTLPATMGAGLVVTLDGERQVITAEREIVLRCGEASITLTRGGKVIIQGSYILSRSTGYNKIKGAAIDIN
jgi:Domain of unknown function (DUF6484)